MVFDLGDRLLCLQVVFSLPWSLAFPGDLGDPVGTALGTAGTETLGFIRYTQHSQGRRLLNHLPSLTPVTHKIMIYEWSASLGALTGRNSEGWELSTMQNAKESQVPSEAGSVSCKSLRTYLILCINWPLLISFRQLTYLKHRQTLRFIGRGPTKR